MPELKLHYMDFGGGRGQFKMPLRTPGSHRENISFCIIVSVPSSLFGNKQEMLIV